MRRRRDPHSWTVGVGERNPSNASSVPAETLVRKEIPAHRLVSRFVSPFLSPLVAPLVGIPDGWTVRDRGCTTRDASMGALPGRDRKSTRLNSSHVKISY